MDKQGPGVASTTPAMVNTWMRGADMAQRTCSVPVCDRQTYHGAMCNAHRMWSYKHGGATPTHAIRPHGAVNRLARMSRPDPTSGCIEWTGFRDSKGYGMVGSDRDTGEQMAHRMAWVIARGRIPRGLTIDHLCRNTGCVNVEHMEVVTPSENSRRMHAVRRSEDA